MRKTLKRNLSYDDRNHLYYVSLYYDGENGRRVRRTRTYPTMEQAEQVIAEYRRAQLLGGSVKYMASQLALPQEIHKQADALSQSGKTPLLFAKNGKLLGLIAVADAIKPESPEAIRQLRGMGIRVVMLTGDNQRTADAIGKLAGVDDVVAGVLPDGKEAVVRELQKYGPVAMVGDGINDAPALTRADIGVAIGAGTDIAIESADVVLMTGSFAAVSGAVELSKATIRNIRQNLFWAFFYNTLGIPLAAGVLFLSLGLKLSPMLGAAAMSLSSVFVVTNALRLRLFKPKTSPSVVEAPKHEEIKTKEDTIMKTVIKVNGMMCGHCKAHVETACKGVPGVTDAVVDLDAKNVTVTGDADVAALKKAITDAGYEVVE